MARAVIAASAALCVALAVGAIVSRVLDALDTITSALG